MSLAGLQLGHYRILRQIGGGAMGEVYLAEDTRIARQVAIKVVRSEAPSYPHSETAKELERLFQREMQVITKLDHPYILPLYDFGEEKVQNMTYTYMVMPYRAEGSLADWLRNRPGNELLSPQDVAHFVGQAADALQHAHDQQLVHQDVKPSNFLIRSRPNHSGPPDLMLADFGIAKFTTATSMASQNVRGTPAYMPPEQWDGRPAPASDQYALAMMAYHLLTGQFPFQGGPGQVMRQHFSVQPPAPSTHNPRLSSALDAVILRALSKEPAARFPTITQFAQAFQQALQYEGDLRATLAIRANEAYQGTKRTLTLPGKRQVTAYVPAGARNGQELRIDGQGEAYYEGGPRGPLVLTISLPANEERAPLAPANDEMTVRSTASFTSSPSRPGYPAANAGETVAPSSSSPYLAPHQQPSWGGFQQSDYITPATPTPATPQFAPQLQSSPQQMPAPYMQAAPPVPARKGISPWVAGLLIIVALLLFSSGGYLLYSTASHQTAMNNIANATGTAQGQTTATAAQQTAAVNTQATANVTTATAQAYATATMQVGATATVVTKNPDPYPPNSRKLALLDPMSQPYLWQNYSDTSFGGSCQFKGNSLHVIQTKSPNYYYCTASTEDYGNSTFEVQMTIIQGDCGGITFRVNTSTNQLYFYRVCADGAYDLYLYTSSSGNSARALLNKSSAVINKGVNQPNLLAVVTNGSQIDLYANKQKIDSISDPTYKQGLFGVVANSLTGVTEVAYSNARLWA
jgi:eukaryotic-like serine/threonine-protein kinase